MTMTTIIHVVDDDESFRDAVARFLETQGYMVSVYGEAKEFLAAPSSGRGCILLDVRMPGMSGLQAQTQWREGGNLMPIIFVTGHGDIPMSVRAIKAGAEEFLTKPVSTADLLAAIESALRRYDETQGRRDVVYEMRSRFETLTRREAEVLDAVVAGKRNKVIAIDLGTAERTIKAHRHQIMSKMKAGSLAELVRAVQLMRESAGS